MLLGNLVFKIIREVLTAEVEQAINLLPHFHGSADVVACDNEFRVCFHGIYLVANTCPN